MKVWIYLDGRQQGPFEKEELGSIEGFGPTTRVWFEGLAKWYPAGELEQFADFFGGEGSPVTTGTSESATMPASDAPAATAPGEDAVATHTTGTGGNTPTPQGRYAPGRIYRPAARPSEPCPPTYLGWSIFLLICCCSPVSLAALAASICVTTFYNNGNLDKARKISEWTAWLVMISFALGMFPVVFMSMLL